MTAGSSRHADGTMALNVGIRGNPGDPANPRLLNGSRALASGASELSAGSTKLASGSSQLATGADKLADGNAKIADGTGTLAVLALGSVGAFLALRKKQAIPR